jgi:hypothetical protein
MDAPVEDDIGIGKGVGISGIVVTVPPRRSQLSPSSERLSSEVTPGLE